MEELLKSGVMRRRSSVESLLARAELTDQESTLLLGLRHTKDAPTPAVAVINADTCRPESSAVNRKASLSQRQAAVDHGAAMVQSPTSRLLSVTDSSVDTPLADEVAATVPSGHVEQRQRILRYVRSKHAAHQAAIAELQAKKKQ